MRGERCEHVLQMEGRFPARVEGKIGLEERRLEEGGIDLWEGRVVVLERVWGEYRV